MSEKCKKKCKYLNYVENLLILVSTVTGCSSISKDKLHNRLFSAKVSKLVTTLILPAGQL